MSKSYDIILIYPPLSVAERYGKNKSLDDIGGNLPPLGILSIAAVLEQEGYKVKIIDGPVSGMSTEEVANEVIKDRPKMVGISSLTSTYYRAKELASLIKQNSDIPIILGGHHTSILPEEIIKESVFDIGVLHEGEITMIEIMKAFGKDPKIIKNKKMLKKIDGIIFKNKNKIVKTRPRKPIENLDDLPFPARHLIDMKKYKPLPNQYKRLPVTNMVVIRGCPFACTYCSNSAIFGKKIRAFSPERVVDEIKHLQEKYKIREISFWDDNMTVNKKWMNDMTDMIVKEGLDITWSCYSRVNTVDIQLLANMKKAGCWNIFYGMESGNQELLNIIEKGITLDDIRRATTWTKNAGIEVRGSFMIALPGETPEMAHKTIDFAIDLDLDYAQFCITTPFPGTKLFNQAQKYGTLIKKYDKFHIWDPVFIPKGYSNADEIKKIEQEAMKRFYLRFGYLIKSISKIRSFEDIKRYYNGLKLVSSFTKK